MKNIQEKALPILSTLHHISGKYGKLYCYPAQLTIMALLGKYQSKNIAIATLNRQLKAMEMGRFIVRVRRIKKDKKRGTIFKSTLYKITLLGYQALRAIGVSVWREIKASTVEGIKAAERALSKFTGPVSLKTILTAPMIFGVKNKSYILEKE